MPSCLNFKENARPVTYTSQNEKVRPVEVPQLSSKASPKATRRDVKTESYIYNCNGS